jgi:hypothetical protein
LVTSRAGDADKDVLQEGFVQMVEPHVPEELPGRTMPIEVKGDQTGLTVQVTEQARRWYTSQAVRALTGY